METITLSQAARKAADNLPCLHSDIIKINTGKLQGNVSFLVSKIREILSSLDYPKHNP